MIKKSLKQYNNLSLTPYITIIPPNNTPVSKSTDSKFMYIDKINLDDLNSQLKELEKNNNNL